MDGKDTESRFSMLLKPIRELADNWNIDVAAELEEYLEDLESVVISFKGGKSNLNFAEAALMIQGSAVVYSKKVEFLYNLVYETLELLSKQKKQRAEGSKEKVSNRIVLDDPVVVMDTSILGERSNIDMKIDEKEMQRRIAMTNNLKRYSVLRLYDSNMSAISSNINKDSKDRSFFLSRCSIAPTGQFTIGTTSTSFLLPNTTQLNSTLHNETNLSITQGHANTPESLLNGTTSLSPNKTMTVLPEPEQSEVDPVTQTMQQEPEPESEPVQSEQHEPAEPAEPESSTKHHANDDDDFELPDAGPYSPEEEEVPQQPKNVWQLVDAFDEKSNQSIPYTRGNVLLNKDTVLRKLQKHQQMEASAYHIPSYTEVTDLFYEYPAEEMSVFKNLQSIAKEKVKKYITAHKPKQTIQTLQSNHSPIPDSNFDMDAFMDDDNDMNNDEGDILTANIDNEEEKQQMLESSRLNISYMENDYSKQFKDLLNTTMFDPLQMNDTDGRSRIDITEQQGDTYEDLCRKHMENFMRGVEQFTRETKLVKRVNEWENRIVPILEEQDKHEEFDLHKNRDEIIDELKEKKEIDVPVAELASERQSYEVSRMFVSLLQMANDGNIKIESGGVCNDMKVKLLNENVHKVDK